MAPFRGERGAKRGGSQTDETKAVAFDNADDAGRLTAEGWALWNKQEVNEAAGKFEQAVKLYPKNVSAWNGLGWATFSASNFEAANKAFHKAIALEPKHPAALNGLGQVALYQQKYADAEKYLLQASSLAPAVRGAVGGAGSQPASFVGDVFREVFKALKETADALPDRVGKTGF